VFDPRDHAPEASEELLGKLGAAPVVARRLLSLIVGRGILDPATWREDYQVPRRVCDAVGELPRLALESSLVSPVDGFQKLAFRTDDGLRIETVLIPLHKPGSVSLCLSSQVGCAMGCVYCATARMSRRRNLATWEIIDQVVQARALVESQGRRVTGAVFMGMGEPFLNYDRVLAAAELLRCPYGAAIRGKAITISTVGLVPEIDRYTREGRKFRLTISLGAATDVKRAELVPVAGRTPVAEVIAAARRHAEARRDRVMIAYVCVGGVNCGEDDARALGALIGDMPVRLDLIDVTDPTGRLTPPTADELSCFRDHLTRHLGQPVARRYSGGSDILAACGTLAGADPTPAAAMPVSAVIS
jgi:23S rRNA (adenine2503-C2)-methyltransferase